MTWRISNDVEMEQTLAALGSLYASLKALRRRVEPQNSRNFAIMAEGHVKDIRHLKHLLDEYAGVVKARQSLSRKPARRAVARRSRRHSAAR
jgi:hypothetical protein